MFNFTRRGLASRLMMMGAVTTAGATLDVAPAQACGGFFCSQQPIDQTAEQIVFSMTPTHVTAYIQIAYQGSAKDFSWVVPVLSKPKITVGSQAVFNQLANLTQPQFNIDTTGIVGQCADQRLADFDAAGPPQAGNAEGVNVLETGEVGPFNYAILESGSANELVDWLNKNGFVQPPDAANIIDHYVRSGTLFVAVKLNKDAMTGEIQPLVLEMPNPEACIPLILTKIAAVPDMPVLAYVLGPKRAFPKNWFHVEPDYAKVNWFAGGQNYRAVATEAIDDAAGHGFITEYAGTASIMKGQLFKPGQFDTANLAKITDPSDFIRALLTLGLPRDAIMQALLRKHIPMPKALVDMGVTEREFYNNIQQYEVHLNGFMVPTAEFIKELRERVILPLENAQRMFDSQSYLTRLLSTVSPNEMTRDPLFHMNGELPNVSNVHVAKAYGACNMDGTVSDYRLELEDGQVLTFDGPVRPFGFGANDVWPYATKTPAAKRLSLVGPTGMPVYVTKAQARLIDLELDKDEAANVRGRIVVTPGADKSSVPDTLPPAGMMVASSGGGCAFAATRPVGGVWLSGFALALGLLFRRRGRSRR